MSHEEFVLRVGREPVDDELERVNCNRAGTIGHFMCGWCNVCDGPNFNCSHWADNVPMPVEGPKEIQ